jgi:putative alpha-1,2-mannosidase
LNPAYSNGKEFKIKVHNNSEANCYIQKATLNNNPLHQLQFTHDDYARGGLLEIWLGSEPIRE